MPKKTNEEFKDCLVGHWFVSFDDDGKGGRKPRHQGKIIDKVDEKHYLAELYSWIDGRITCRKVMADIYIWNYDFYADHADFVDAATDTFRAFRELQS